MEPIAEVMIVLAVAGFAIVGLALWRTLTLFHLSIRKGQVLAVRGRIPPVLLNEIREIVRISKVESGTIRVVKDGGDARLVCSDEIDESTKQRIRNVLGQFPIAKLRHAPRIDRGDR